MARPRRALILVPGALLLLALLAAVALLANTKQAEPGALAALESDERTSVVDAGWLVFRPRDRRAEAGLVFYPGGLVPAEAYAPLARAIAAEGYLVALVRMPLNLAVLDSERGRSVIAARPEIDRWVMGGHSLGGSMAARFAAMHAQEIDGLLLLAAWPEEGVDLSASGIKVSVVYGSEDGLATPAEVLSARPRLPADTAFVLIEGGNHAQFGRYGRQDGDNEALIPAAAQQAQTVAAAVALLREAGAAR